MSMNLYAPQHTAFRVVLLGMSAHSVADILC
jgi:hypothetical protein